MKKAKNTEKDMRAEYDFGSMKGGVRGKYSRRYRTGTNLVLLEPDLVDSFPDDESVNEALRAAVKMAAVVHRHKRPTKKRAQSTSRVRQRARSGK